MLNTAFNIYLTISTHPQIIGKNIFKIAQPRPNQPIQTHPNRFVSFQWWNPRGVRPYLPWRCDCHSVGSTVPSPSSPSVLRALQAWRRRFLRRTELAPGHHTTRPSPIRRWQGKQKRYRGVPFFLGGVEGRCLFLFFFDFFFWGWGRF